MVSSAALEGPRTTAAPESQDTGGPPAVVSSGPPDDQMGLRVLDPSGEPLGVVAVAYNDYFILLGRQGEVVSVTYLSYEAVDTIGPGTIKLKLCREQLGL